jgi:hypothetical protein
MRQRMQHHIYERQGRSEQGRKVHKSGIHNQQSRLWRVYFKEALKKKYNHAYNNAHETRNLK